MSWLNDFDSKQLPVIEDLPPVQKGALLVEAVLEDDGIKLVFDVKGQDIGFKLERPTEQDPDNIFKMKKIKIEKLAKVCGCKPSQLVSAMDSLIGSSFTLTTVTKTKTARNGKSYTNVNLYDFVKE